MTYEIPVSKPYKEGWISSASPSVDAFEKAFSKYMGAEYGIACSSGTTALTLAVRALNLSPGDEVIVPEFTMIATAWGAMYGGGTPVFVDCGDDLNIDVDKIEAAITPRTKAIIPVHIYGRPANMDKIMELAHDYNLWVIEDAAEAHGATIGDKYVGSIGHIGCFSFYANKIITTGEGGMVITSDKRLAEQVRHLCNVTFSEDHSFLHRKHGYNFRMSGLQAELGLRQFAQLDEILLKRKDILEWYDAKLKHLTIPRPEGSVLWMYDILVPNRDYVMEKLKEEGIETRVFFKPMSAQPMFKQEKGFRARTASGMGMYLPTYPELTKEEVDYISDLVLKYVKD